MNLALDIMKRNVKMRLRQAEHHEELLRKLDETVVDRSHRHIAKLCDMLFAAHAGEVEVVRESLQVSIVVDDIVPTVLVRV